jgi:hypothetical protein
MPSEIDHSSEHIDFVSICIQIMLALSKPTAYAQTSGCPGGSAMEIKFDGLAQLLQGQSVVWILAASVLVLCVAVLILSFKIRAGNRR